MANHPLSAGIRRFVFGTRTLCSTVASRASTLHAPLLRKLKSPKQNPLLVLQNWVDKGNDVSPSQFRSIARTLVKSKRYHHALEHSKVRGNRKLERLAELRHDCRTPSDFW